MPIIFGQVIFFKIHRICQILTAIIFIAILFNLYSIRSLMSKGSIFGSKSEIIGRPDMVKYVHLDLKGAPPKAEQFYPSFFQFLDQLQMGVKGVLIEYEDTLPLQGNLLNATHRSGYTKSDINLIVESAKKHQLEIIPLIQTFGHLEWLLKLDEYQSYRDNEQLPTVISPCINLTYDLLEDLLRQTLDLHPHSQMIHIGCDEVVLTNSHPSCSSSHLNTYERYLNHIERIVQIVRQIRPNIRVLIWDDILRNHQSTFHQNSLQSLTNLVEPVSWNYFPQFEDQFKYSSIWKSYRKYFSHLWTASAFKGGLHRYSMSTNTTHHVLNNQQWLEFIQSSAFPRDTFAGMILTGWSRFDHFMPLCDLLPTAYPSLLNSLHVLNTNEVKFNEQIRTCEQMLQSLGKNSELCQLLPGRSIMSNIFSLSNLLIRIQKHVKLLYTIAPEYNRQYSFIRRYELETFLKTLYFLIKDLTTAKQTLQRSLSELYHDDVINEWFALYLHPIEKQMNNTMNELTPTLTKRTWLRRPFS